MQVTEVSNKALEQEFLDLPKQLYRKDTNWVCPLDVEIRGIFSPSGNVSFQEGSAARWLLRNDKGENIGRIAAFYDRKKTNLYKYPTGGAGFFECINDQEAANMLFDTARNWLQKEGLQAMLAPVNFGENYNHWGCLVEGFIRPTYAMPYNFPYYAKLFENYGFRNYFEQYSYQKKLAEDWPERMVKFAEYTETRPGYSFEHFKFDNIDKYIDDFVFTYNAIWSRFHDGYTPLDRGAIHKMIWEARLVIDEELIWFAYDQGKPAGLLVVFPDINQILAKLKNGKLNLINKIKFFYYRKRAITQTRAIMAGILPEYQNSGIIAALYYQLVKVLRKRPGQVLTEMSWVGDYNPKMMSIYDKIGCKKVKTHITYMHLFDDELEFRRFDNEFEGKLYHVRDSLRTEN